MKQIVAIPTLGNRVAPCFEASQFIDIVTIEDSRIIDSKTINCENFDGFRRIRQLNIHDVDVLLCSGIKDFYLNLISTSKIVVYPRIMLEINEALEQFISGKLPNRIVSNDRQNESCDIPHDELVVWASDYFKKNGYAVDNGPGGDFFLIDLIAKIECPICSKPINVAICCGAHTYSIDQEICEFYNMAKDNFNARAFVYPQNDSVLKRCLEYGIEMISPDSDRVVNIKPSHEAIPILQGEIDGHDKLPVRSNEK